MADRIQIRRVYTANWNGEIPLVGELALETDASPPKLRAGDGSTAGGRLVGAAAVQIGTRAISAAAPDDGDTLVYDQASNTFVYAPGGTGGGGTGGYETMPADVMTSSSVITFDPVTSGWHQRVTLAHNMTAIAITKPTSAADKSRIFTLDVIQGTGGSNLYTLPSAEASWTNCKFPGGVVPPVMTGTNSIATKYIFQWNGRRDCYELINVVYPS